MVSAECRQQAEAGSCCRRCSLQSATVFCFHAWLQYFFPHHHSISFVHSLVHHQLHFPKKKRWSVINYNSILQHILLPSVRFRSSLPLLVLPNFQFFPSSCLFPPEASMCCATALDASSCKRCHHLNLPPRRLLESLVARK